MFRMSNSNDPLYVKDTYICLYSILKMQEYEEDEDEFIQVPSESELSDVDDGNDTVTHPTLSDCEVDWEDKYYYKIYGREHFDSEFALMNLIFEKRLTEWLESEMRDCVEFTLVPSNIFLPDYHQEEEEYREAARVQVIEKIKQYLSKHGYNYNDKGKTHVRVEFGHVFNRA